MASYTAGPTRRIRASECGPDSHLVGDEVTSAALS
jgi:hypothetical protein